MIFSTIAISIVGLLVTLFISSYLQTIRSPLTNIPGPWYTRHTSLPLLLATLTGNRMYFVHSLHTTYGPYVRISPSGISIADPDSYITIHRIGSPFVKSAWYTRFLNFRREILFTSTDLKEHNARRKLFSRGYSKAHVERHWEGMIGRKARLTAVRAREESERDAEGRVDWMKWCKLMSMDVTAEIMHGKRLRQVEDGKESTWSTALQKSMMGAGIGAELPWLRSLCLKFPFKAFQETFSINGMLLDRCQEVFETSDVDRSETIFSTVAADAEKSGQTFDRWDAVYETVSHMIAGSDTTAITLVYLIWAVLSDAALQKQIEEEVASLNEDFTNSDVEGLPILSAVIQETLRLYGAAPSGLPRTVPAGGVTMGGHFLPAGMIVSTQSYTFHRDPTIYPSPGSFDHTRFLSPNAQVEGRGAHLSPFSYGPYSCIGKAIAYMELRLASAAFFRECRGARLAAETTRERMRLVDHFLIAPEAGRCMLRLGGEG